MFTITATVNHKAGSVTAKGHGKQRTVKVTGSQDTDHGAAVGALLNVLCDSRQQAMLRHPSGRQRVQVRPEAGRTIWSVDV